MATTRFDSAADGTAFGLSAAQYPPIPSRNAIPDGVTSIESSYFEGNNELTSIVIPDSVELIGESAFMYCANLTSITIGSGVKCIGLWAFGSCTALKHITIPANVEFIGDEAFCNCTGLESVEICEGVKGAGEGAFANTGLKSVTIPSSFKYIEPETFSACPSLTSVTLPDTLTHIGQEAFEGCTSLQRITIPKSVVKIRPSAFNNCNELIEITVEKGNEHYAVKDGALIGLEDGIVIKFLKNKEITSLTIQDYMESLCVREVAECFELEEYKVSPDNPHYTAVDGVLFDKNKEYLYSYPPKKQGVAYAVPLGIKAICGNAFYKCAELVSIEIPDSVTTIGSAFKFCTNLASITFPPALERLANRAFTGCASLKSIVFPNCLDSFCYEGEFMGCTALEHITFPDNLEYIDEKVLDFKGRNENLKVTFRGKTYNVSEFDKFIKVARELSDERERIKKREAEKAREEARRKLAEALSCPDTMFEVAIEDLDFGVRAFNVLKRHGLNTIGDIAALTKAELREVRNIGKKSYEEVINKLEELGITLKEE